MTKKSSLAQDKALLGAVHAISQRAIARGCNPAELSQALTVVAVRIGLEFAPPAGVAFAVVVQAISDAAVEWASSLQDPNADLGRHSAPHGTTIH
jgi:hypothetical protein